MCTRPTFNMKVLPVCYFSTVTISDDKSAKQLLKYNELMEKVGLYVEGPFRDFPKYYTMYRSNELHDYTELVCLILLQKKTRRQS